MGKLILISGGVLIVLIVGVVLFIYHWGPDLRQFEHLKEPQIRNMSNQKMIEVQLKGDPNVTAGKGIGQLFGTFYQLKNNRLKASAPRARWPESFDTARKDWVGIFGLPVSDSVTDLPTRKNEMKVKLTTWEYGIVAEILHIGPYTTENTTIERLKQFIKDQGYDIVGDHEEEYVKGPGMLPTNPKDYYTVIRYRIQKK